MKVHDICQKVAFNALKVGDFVKHKDVIAYFYKIIEKVDGQIVLKVYSERTGVESPHYPHPEKYMPTDLYKKN